VEAPLLEMGLGVDVGVYEVAPVKEVVEELEAAVGMYMLVEFTAYVEVTV
jgi:hypothetical protein